MGQMTLDELLESAKAGERKSKPQQPRLKISNTPPKRRVSKPQISTYLTVDDYDTLAAAADRLHMSRGALLLELHVFRTGAGRNVDISNDLRHVESLLLGDGIYDK